MRGYLLSSSDIQLPEEKSLNETNQSCHRDEITQK